MATKYRDGTVVQGSGPELYVILDGQRHLIEADDAAGHASATALRTARPTSSKPGTRAPEEANTDAKPVRISNTALLGIPQGQAIEAPLVASREDEVVSDRPRRYMATTVKLSRRSGRVDGDTRTWTRQPWIGFTGGVMVLFADANNEYIGNTDLIQFGVDGFRVPFKRWQRLDHWVQSVPTDVAARTRSMEIVHSHAPKDRFFKALEDAKRAAKAIGEIVAIVRTVV